MVQDGQNPLEVISCLQSAQSQLVTGHSQFPACLRQDPCFAQLPGQLLWIDQHLSSGKVASANHAEWQRRQMDSKEGTVLLVDQNSNNKGSKKWETFGVNIMSLGRIQMPNMLSMAIPLLHDSSRGKRARQTLLDWFHNLCINKLPPTPSAHLSNVIYNSDGSFNTYIN